MNNFDFNLSDAQSRHMTNVYSAVANSLLTTAAGYYAATKFNWLAQSSFLLSLVFIVSALVVGMASKLMTRQLALTAFAFASGAMVYPLVATLQYIGILTQVVLSFCVTVVAVFFVGLFAKSHVQRTIVSAVASLSGILLLSFLIGFSGNYMLYSIVSSLLLCGQLSYKTYSICESIKFGAKRDVIKDAFSIYSDLVSLFIKIAQLFLELDKKKREDESRKRRK
eukprot:GDKJ01012328.1.p1 GENE.GDKJ01012328.1~~GDKJ01012328.1.p1  ORF type:complete len:238 (-),score=31.55 GDKJ01012328.1:63-734(-)